MLCSRISLILPDDRYETNQWIDYQILESFSLIKILKKCLYPEELKERILVANESRPYQIKRS